MRIRATLLLGFTLAAGCGEPAPRVVLPPVPSDQVTPETELPVPQITEPFTATFLIIGSNPWWIDAEVSANEVLSGVDARIDGGSWKPLDPTVRSSWEGHFRIPRGSTVELRARSRSGAEVLSDPFEWPVAAAVSSPQEPQLPDLVISEGRLSSSWYLSPEYVAPDSCTAYERCVSGTGWRLLLRFAAEIQNVGTADVAIGDPRGSDDFEFSACHAHYHFKEAADYALLNPDGTTAAAGHKQAFCFADIAPVSGWNTPRNYPYSEENCNSNMGLSVGWGDVYGAHLDCQFIDVTDVPAGQYLLSVTANPEGYMQESDFENNSAEVRIEIP